MPASALVGLTIAQQCFVRDGFMVWVYIYIGLACQLDQGNSQVIPTVVPPCRHGLQPNLIIKHESGYGTVLTHAHR